MFPLVEAPNAAKVFPRLNCSDTNERNSEARDRVFAAKSKSTRSTEFHKSLSLSPAEDLFGKKKEGHFSPKA